MWQLYQAEVQDILAAREAEAEAVRIERLVSQGIDPFAGRSGRPGLVRRAAAALAAAVSRRADILARSLDAEVAGRASR
jgi:hypothetical protein